MSYMDIENLYKNRDILLFKECYAMEKIHGTSAHVGWNGEALTFFAGGCKHESFLSLFNQPELSEKMLEKSIPEVVIYGEAYGGKCQGMGDTYGKDLGFVAFEVKIGKNWLTVPSAEEFSRSLGMDFVDYRLIPTTLEAIDAERDRDSVQAVKNGCGDGKKREGIVLRPLIEVTKNNGDRIIAKHKRDDFKETKTPRPLDKDKFEVLQKAQEIADEWVTEMRLTHVLDSFPGSDITKTGEIISAMVSDVLKESGGEIVDSKEARAAVGRKTALMFKDRIKASLG